MGICYGGKTLKEAQTAATQLFEKTGRLYGLKELPLLEQDPIKLAKFQSKLVAACVQARDTAKLITANPIALIMSELQFMLGVPEGDLVSSSYGLIGHLQSAPFVVRYIAETGLEEDGIKSGDIFSSNDPKFGAPHPADCFTTIPIFYDGVLMGWAMGMSHIADTGSIQPGGLSAISVSSFTDGYFYPPMKTGENFKQYRWYYEQWQRKTRAGDFNVMDERMRATGATMLHDKVIEIIKEFGPDYYREALKEIMERERRVLTGRVMSETVPGKYEYQAFNRVNFKGLMTNLWPRSDRDWLLNEGCDTYINPDGSLTMDLEGTSSEDEFYANCYESGLRMVSSLGCWPTFAYSKTLNTALQYMTHWKIPPGSMYNPQSPSAGAVTGLIEGQSYLCMFLMVISQARLARGFLEETYTMAGTGSGIASTGAFSDGFEWQGGDWSHICAKAGPPSAFKDGETLNFGGPAPQSDLGEMEATEFIQPTCLYIGRRPLQDYFGHGKYRCGVGLSDLLLIVEPGKRLDFCASAGSGGGVCEPAYGMCGGYPSPNDINAFFVGTNMKEILANGGTYPRDLQEARQWMKEGKLKVDRFFYYNNYTPTINLKDGDIFGLANGLQPGWGDVLERSKALVARDVGEGSMSEETARKVYGVAFSDGKVDERETEKARKQIRDKRRERSVDVQEWWKQERERVRAKEFYEDVNNMYWDCLKWEKFRRKFMGFWQLPEDYSLSMRGGVGNGS